MRATASSVQSRDFRNSVHWSMERLAPRDLPVHESIGNGL